MHSLRINTAPDPVPITPQNIARICDPLALLRHGRGKKKVLRLSQVSGHRTTEGPESAGAKSNARELSLSKDLGNAPDFCMEARMSLPRPVLSRNSPLAGSLVGFPRSTRPRRPWPRLVA